MVIVTFFRRITSLHLSVATALLVGTISFWWSFTALTDLAASTRVVPEGQAWGWPIVVDGMIIAATISASAMSGRRRWYAWLLLILASSVSIWANGIHAWLLSDGSLLAVAVAVTPPTFLLLVTHLTVMLAHEARVETTSTESPTRLGFDVPAPAPAQAPPVRVLRVEPEPVRVPALVELPEPDFDPVVLDHTRPGRRPAADRVAAMPTIDDLMTRQG